MARGQYQDRRSARYQHRKITPTGGIIPGSTSRCHRPFGCSRAEFNETLCSSRWARECAHWSRDGRWLYFVIRTRLRRLRFRLEVPPAPWETIRSSVYRCSVVRVHPDGASRQVVASQLGFGFADRNILADGSVVFSRVGDDLNLWRHRRLGLTMRRVTRYEPHIRIERAHLDHHVRILVRRGHSPVVQP